MNKDNQIILDRDLAMRVVLAAFQSEAIRRPLRCLYGRFTRSLLNRLVWSKYSKDEQDLFLSLMISCGVCFVHRPGDEKLCLETHYVAPDFLPDRDEVEEDVQDIWIEVKPRHELTIATPSVRLDTIRHVLCLIGQAAGMNAVYWKYGVCFYESTTCSRALIEQERELDGAPADWGVRIKIQTRGGQAIKLSGYLHEWIKQTINEASCYNIPEKEMR